MNNLNTPVISTLKDENGNSIGSKVYAATFLSLVDFMGANMTPKQIDLCAVTAYKHYSWMTIKELKQFVLKVMAAEYTSNKNFCAPVLMEWLKQYTDERLADRYDHFSQQKVQPKKQIILSIEHLKGRSYRYMKWYFGEVEKERQRRHLEMIEGIKAIAQNMGQPVKNIEDEEDYKRIKAESHVRLQQKRISTTNPDTDAKCA